MDKEQKSLELLIKFFRENSQEYIDSVIERINETNIEGETFESYVRNLERERNFYELALQLAEGQITEKEYNQEIDNNPEKYVVNYEE